MPDIAILQIDCNKHIQGKPENLAPYIEEAAEKGAEIICLPELYRNCYFCQEENPENFSLAEPVPGPSTDFCATYARKYNMVILVPVFEHRASGIYHNSVAVIDTDGSLKGIYRKTHIPHDPGFEEKYYFTPGEENIKVFDTQYGRIAPLICWDQWYPEAARIAALKGAQIIFYPTAIAWDDRESKEEGTEQLEAWETIQRSHSIANHVYVCAVNRVGTEGHLHFWGNSIVYGPFGKILHKSGNLHEEIIVINCDFAETEKFRKLWPFFRDRRIDLYEGITQRTLVNEP